tara:strand:- start:38981 stop:40402 length:1422 start_codon:yes stop_codon:yes gene_type:complete
MFDYQKLINNQVLIFTLGGVLPAVLNFLFLPIYSLILNPEDFGLFSYSMSFQSILIVLSSLSLNTFLLRKYFDFTDSKDKNKLISSVFFFLLLFNLLLLLLLINIFPILLPLINSSVDYYPYFFLMIIGLFFEFFFIFPMIIFRVEKLAKFYVLFSVLKQIITFILSFTLIMQLDIGILGRFIGVVIANAIFAFISFIVLYKRISFRYEKEIITEGLRFSAPLIPAALIGSIYVALDKILLINYLTLSELGLYTLAASLASVVNFFSLGYYRAVETVIFESYGSDIFEEKVHKINKFQLIILFWFGLMFSLFSAEILFYFFDKGFYQSYVYIPFFIAALLINGQKRIFGTVLHANKVTKFDFPLMLLTFLSYITLFYLLVPHYEIYAALYALIITSLLSLICTLFLVSKYYSIKSLLDLTFSFLIILALVNFFIQEELFLDYKHIILIKITILIVSSVFMYFYIRNNNDLLPD